MKSNSSTTTVSYYDQNADKFVADTAFVEFDVLQKRFVRMLGPDARILDLGCGSGRDSKAFLEMGYSVVAMDGSEEMCRLASDATGLDVTQAFFEEYEPDGLFDGIWACSSLLHLPLGEISSVLRTCTSHLKTGGVLYMSFKYGWYSGERNGRYFTDLDEKGLETLLAEIPELDLVETNITGDMRPGRADEKWLNAWCRRK